MLFCALNGGKIMITKSKRILSSLLAMLLLVTGLLPLSASAAEVTMDLSKCEVSWDYTLTDEEGNPFDAAYGVKEIGRAHV